MLEGGKDQDDGRIWIVDGVLNNYLFFGLKMGWKVRVLDGVARIGTVERVPILRGV